MKPKHVYCVALMIFVLLFIPQNSTRAFDSDIILPAGYNDMVIDDARGVIYGSGGWSFGSSINYIDVISIDTMDIQRRIPVGVDSAGIDMSPDGSELAVAMYGEGVIKILSLDTLTVTTVITPQGVTAPNLPWDVVYGREGRMYSVGGARVDYGDPTWDYIHEFDTNTWTELRRTTGEIAHTPYLTVNSDKTALYAHTYIQGDGRIYKYDISGDLPEFPVNTPERQENMRHSCYLGDRLYANTGQIWSSDVVLLGTLPITGDWIGCSEERQQVCITKDNTFACYDVTNDKIAFNNTYPGYDLEFGLPIYVAAQEMWYISSNLGMRQIDPNSHTYNQYVPYMLLNWCQYVTKFTEDFDDGPGYWPVGMVNGLSVEVTEGEYQVVAGQEPDQNLERLKRIAAPICGVDENYEVEVAFHLEESSNACICLMYAVADNGIDYRCFELCPESQTYSAWLHQRYGWGYYLGASDVFSPYINAGTGRNTVRIEVIDWLQRIYVNDNLLLEASGAAMSGGPPFNVGLGILPGTDTAFTSVRFDDFSLYRLDENGNRLSN